ncbi:MAG: DUF5698 domain-containing protein [Bacilli bacterium]
MDTLILCIVIFFVRIIETSISTVRQILMIKERRMISTILAFCEILIWFLIVKEAINDTSDSIFVALSYASGFATGTYVGMLINKYAVISDVSVNVVINNNEKMLVDELVLNNYAVSISKIVGKDLKKKKSMLFIVTTTKRLNKLKKIIYKYENKAFISINDTKLVINGYK